MNTWPTKPCKYCGNTNHWPYQCFKNPKRKPINPIGKRTTAWLKYRRSWIRKHPPNDAGYWECYLQIHEYCPRWLTIQTLTLDHVVARSRKLELIFDEKNLKPACGWCNDMKGSQPLDAVLLKR